MRAGDPPRVHRPGGGGPLITEADRSLPRLGHVPALDGIRGLAVGIVLLHHLKVPGVHGGWLGVDLFFALSGFLITQSVLAAGAEGGLRRFWERRAWRIGPAMAVLLAWYLAVSITATDRGMRFRWFGASALQVLNIHDAASKHGPFSPHLGHLWSLSAEMQFYVVWPLLLVVLLRRHVSRVAIVGVAAGLFVVSCAERTVLALQHEQWNRLYYGPDVRSTALWAGCLVGLLWYWGAFDRSPVLRPAARVLAAPAFAMFGVLVILPSMAFSTSNTPYLWGLTVAGLCAVVLVAAGASCGGGPLRPLLEARPLEFLGRISYSVYLWHVPLIAELVRARPDIGTPAKVAIIVPASLLLGWLSYVVVERPLLSATRRARLGRLLTPVG